MGISAPLNIVVIANYYLFILWKKPFNFKTCQQFSFDNFHWIYQPKVRDLKIIEKFIYIPSEIYGVDEEEENSNSDSRLINIWTCLSSFKTSSLQEMYQPVYASAWGVNNENIGHDLNRGNIMFTINILRFRDRSIITAK